VGWSCRWWVVVQVVVKVGKARELGIHWRGGERGSEGKSEGRIRKEARAGCGRMRQHVLVRGSATYRRVTGTSARITASYGRGRGIRDSNGQTAAEALLALLASLASSRVVGSG
jgi:hypothetical protein